MKTQDDCWSLGGEPSFGACDDAYCPIACCVPWDFGCEPYSRETCENMGGTVHNSLTCNFIECEHACCLDSGCAMMTAQECWSLGGEPTPGECTLYTCPPGGCCYGDGSCWETYQHECSPPGRWLGYGSYCSDCLPNAALVQGTVLLTGIAEFPDFESDTASVFLNVYNGQYSGSGSTSSGLLGGSASVSGHLSNTMTDAVISLEFYASSQQSAPLGQGFFGVSPESCLEVQIGQPMVYHVVGQRDASFVPQTGAVVGEPRAGLLQPGIYCLNYLQSGLISPGQTQATFNDTITIPLRPCTGTSASPAGCWISKARFNECLSGPNQPADCAEADCDGDGDVDLRDYAAHQASTE